ncbi:unnamed protein product [Lactuca saligna]|uniref:F-box domain-containing protein n=1 Tax=Lactuca saligna TaxID=75948 RepID=A0AA35YS61_LACSI|nr:unnamed protein product [Lactuca saligna]
MARRKSVRVSKRAKRWIKVDRISRLPDDLIDHIYSFLDSKSSVQSSLLSRRWRNTWKCHPRLKFETDLSTGHKFDNFAQKFLSKRKKDAQIPIIHFRSNSIPIRLLKKIISYSMSHGTKTLSILYMNDIPTRRGGFDLSLLKSPFLQDLHLDIDFQLFKSPNLSWYLPTLTTLHLQKVTFTLDPPNDDGSLELFSAFSNLRYLMLLDCRLWNVRTFYITSSGLENLTLICLVHSCQFVISAPNLSSFIYDHMTPSLLLANNLDSLEMVSFRTIYDRPTENLPNYVETMINTFHQLHKVKHLILDKDAVFYISRFCGLLERRPCPFVALESLTFDEMPSSIFRNHVVFDNIISYFRSGSPGCIAYIEYI